MKIAALIAACLAAAAKADVAGRLREGQDTSYELLLYSKPGYRGEAVRFQPELCTSLRKHNVTAQSIKYAGNSCCLFFPRQDCSDTARGQRVVGNVRDVKPWGFPGEGGEGGEGGGSPAAVKCYSHAACAVMRYQLCEFDRSCGAGSINNPAHPTQGTCPFEPGCAAYHPVHEHDWQGAHPAATSNWSPVRERFQVDEDGDPVGRGSSSSSSSSDEKADRPSELTQEDGPVVKTGGTDDYGNPRMKAPGGLHKDTDKKMKEQHEKAKKKAAKQRKKDQTKHKKIKDAERKKAQKNKDN